MASDEGIQGLIEKLYVYDWWENEIVKSKLVKIGKPAIEHLCKKLNEPNQSVRLTIVRVIIEIGGSEIVEPLIGRLKDRHGSIIIEVIQALGEIKDVRAVEPLMEIMNNPYSNIRQNIVNTLEKIGEPAVPFLIKALGDEDSDVRYYAVEALGKIGDKRAVVPLIERLGDEDSNVRWRAAKALGKIGEPAVEPLIGMLEDKSVGRTAIYELGKMKDERAVGPLVKLLDHDDWFIYQSAAEALEKIGLDKLSLENKILCLLILYKIDEIVELGEETIDVMEGLVRALDHRGYNVRRAAAEALEKIGLDKLSLENKILCLLILERDGDIVKLGSQSVEEVMNRLEDRCSIVRRNAVKVLGGIRDPRVVEPLIGMLGDPFKENRKWIIWALGETRDMRTIKPLMENPAKLECGVNTVDALANFGEHAVEPLIKFLDETDSSVVLRAIEVLGGIRDPRVVEALVGKLNNKDSTIRETVAKVLGNVGDRKAIDGLFGLLDDPERDVRNEAIMSLRKIGDPSVVEPLIGRLWDKKVRLKIVKRLGEIGDLRAIEPLIEMMDSPSKKVRDIVESALIKIVEKNGSAAIRKIKIGFGEFVEKQPTQKERGAAQEEVQYRLTRITIILRRQKEKMQGVISEGKPKAPARTGKKVIRVQRVGNI